MNVASKANARQTTISTPRSKTDTSKSLAVTFAPHPKHDDDGLKDNKDEQGRYDADFDGVRVEH
jgi:hypothetical protein